MEEVALTDAYEAALKIIESSNFDDMSLNEQRIGWLTALTTSPENRRGVLAVLTTSLTKKIADPRQDIRLHQNKMVGGYSGRTLDTKVITPFLRAKGYPSMSESGWLTRSLEQSQPYDFSYPGEIKPNSLKQAFLNILDDIEHHPELAKDYLVYLLVRLEQEKRIRSSSPVIRLPETLARQISVSNVVACLDQHFNARYPKSMSGAARLPVLALYSVYQCLMSEVVRYRGKELLPLESHTSPDARSGRIGDIDIIEFVENISRSFEAVEVKFKIPVSFSMVELAYTKIKSTTTQRYYILSTLDVREEDRVKIATYLVAVKEEHGVEIILNGVIPSLTYYLRLLGDLGDFLNYYSDNLQFDKAIKKGHRDKWNEIISSVLQERSGS